MHTGKWLAVVVMVSMGVATSCSSEGGGSEPADSGGMMKDSADTTEDTESGERIFSQVTSSSACRFECEKSPGPATINRTHIKVALEQADGSASRCMTLALTSEEDEAADASISTPSGLFVRTSNLYAVSCEDVTHFPTMHHASETSGEITVVRTSQGAWASLILDGRFEFPPDDDAPYTSVVELSEHMIEPQSNCPTQDCG